jgi:hypothetical protein
MSPSLSDLSKIRYGTRIATHQCGLVRKLRAEPALPSLLRYQHRKSFITSIFPVAWHEYRCRSSQMSVVRSPLWKIALPLILIIAPQPTNTRHVERFSSVEMAARMWKCCPENIGLRYVRPLSKTKRQTEDRGSLSFRECRWPGR